MLFEDIEFCEKCKNKTAICFNCVKKIRAAILQDQKIEHNYRHPRER